MALVSRLNKQKSWMAPLRSWCIIHRRLLITKCDTLGHGVAKGNPPPLSLLCMKPSRLSDVLPTSDRNCELALLFQALSLRDTSSGISNKINPLSHHYIFPTMPSNTLWKKTIIDPNISPLSYNLPTSTSKMKEKVTPSLDRILPMFDPDRLQPVIDQGAPPISKQTMPWLVQIRKRKMKKHKLKKLRKRMRFVYRRQREIKAKRKEKAIQMEVKQILKEAEDFDPEKFVEEELKKARLGGWKIDIMEEHHKAKKDKAAGHISGQNSEISDAKHADRQSM